MYGIIMVAILTGIIGIQIMKRRSIKDIGIAIEIRIKRFSALSNWRSIFWIGLGSCRCLSRPDIILLGAGFGVF
jgi:hypothetical protein